jgi:hypothetical protein
MISAILYASGDKDARSFCTVFGCSVPVKSIKFVLPLFCRPAFQEGLPASLPGKVLGRSKKEGFATVANPLFLQYFA